MEYWYLWLILAGLVIITAVVIVFAGRSVSAHNEQTKEIMARLERLKEMKDKYKDLTPEKVENAEAEELFEGVNAVLQAKIEKADDGDKAFSEFNDEQKIIYTLNCFIPEVSDGLSMFFNEYTNEITDIIVPALTRVGADDLLPLVKSEYEMYDDRNEDVSFDRDTKEKTDSDFADVYSKEKLLEKIKEFIKNNMDKF
jgi:hypothetical protein